MEGANPNPSPPWLVKLKGIYLCPFSVCEVSKCKKILY